MDAKIEHNYNSPRWSSEFADCSLPMSLDTYSNCSYGCAYCFSQFQRGWGNSSGNYLSKSVKSVNPGKVVEIIKGERKSPFLKYVKDRRPIQYGGLSDQFDEFERKYGVTYEILKELKKVKYPISFSTKGAWCFFDEKYRKLFEGANFWHLKMSIITLDENDARQIERGVASPQKRLDAMREFKNLSQGSVTLRLRPFIVGVSSKTYLDLIVAAHDAGADSVTTEFLCIDNRMTPETKKSFQIISDVAGFDILQFYRAYSNGVYKRLNGRIKAPYIEQMKELCEKLGMRFYVSDPHFKECSNNCCCCGLNTEWNYSHGNFAYALQLAKEKGVVYWKDIEKEMPFFEDTPAVKVLATLKKRSRAEISNMSIKEYMHYLWNEIERPQSPYKVFRKALVPCGRDSEGNIIYRYNGESKFDNPLGERLLK